MVKKLKQTQIASYKAFFIRILTRQRLPFWLEITTTTTLVHWNVGKTQRYTIHDSLCVTI